MKGTLKVRFTSGREESFEVDFWAGTGAAARLKEFAKNPTLLLRTDKEVVLIPGAAVEEASLAVSEREMAGLNLPEIRAAKRV
jgi:hypothetical protein